MGPESVVPPPPPLDQNLRLLQGAEDLSVQQLVAELAVEALHVAVLPRWYRRTFTKLRENAELRPTIGLHSLRHSYASLLIRQGENPKYVSRQMGHASVGFTLDSYTHVFEETSTELHSVGALASTTARVFTMTCGGHW